MALVVAGFVFWFFEGRGVGPGRLPGDIVIRRGSYTLVFPIVTCIILSIVLTLLFRLFNR